MRVLVACEFSGTVRRAFMARGHEAWSCDLLPAEDASPFHIEGDALDAIGRGWDLLIAHPPCTHLAVSGARWFAEKRAEQAEALAFVRALLEAPSRISASKPGEHHRFTHSPSGSDPSAVAVRPRGNEGHLSLAQKSAEAQADADCGRTRSADSGWPKARTAGKSAAGHFRGLPRRWPRSGPTWTGLS